MAANFAFKDVSPITCSNGNNFSMWKYRLSLVLESQKLNNLVFAGAPKPTPVTNAEGVITNAQEIQTWTDQDVVATKYVSATVEDLINETLINC